MTPSESEPDPVTSATPRTRSTTARIVSAAGEVLLTFGIIFGLFAAYQVWWTNVVASRDTAQARDAAQQYIAAPGPAQGPDSGTDQANAVPANGQAFALMYIPRLKDKVWGLPVLQGTGPKQLAEGVGHYPLTAMPGQPGNFAAAGHRATHGEPFADFDQLRDGDKVYIQTRGAWYTYTLEHDKIIDPSESWVITPSPLPPGILKSDRLITLTTCNPRWGSTQRWAYWGVLTGTQPDSAGTPDGIKV